MITDPCPTSVCSLTVEDHRSLPLMPWFAAQRHREAMFPAIRNIFDEAMADIETMGLLKQAERVESATGEAQP